MNANSTSWVLPQTTGLWAGVAILCMPASALAAEEVAEEGAVAVLPDTYAAAAMQSPPSEIVEKGMTVAASAQRFADHATTQAAPEPARTESVKDMGPLGIGLLAALSLFTIYMMGRAILIATTEEQQERLQRKAAPPAPPVSPDQASPQ